MQRGEICQLTLGEPIPAAETFISLLCEELQ